MGSIGTRRARPGGRLANGVNTIVALGGYISCPYHHVPPDTRWEIVQYYCERMRTGLGG